MPQWKQYSGTWPLQTQMQAIADGTWTGLPILYGIGINANGELGTNNVNNVSSPVQLGSPGSWTSMTASKENHSHGVKSSGSLWSWGGGFYGEFGTNSTVPAYRSSPVQVGALTNWSSNIAALANSTIAIKTDGTMWSWGSNAYGELGQNTVNVNLSSPVQIGAGNTWIKVAPGYTFVNAIKTDGTMWSWGRGDFGQIGDNNRIERSSPVQIGALTTWLQSSCGNYFSAAVKTDYTLWTWGANSAGQLGLDDRANRSSPVQVGAGTDWANVSCASTSTAAVKTNGTLWVWGTNAQGQLGLNDVVARSSPVQVGALTNWASCSGLQLAFFAIKTDGTIWSWGYNVDGRLGHNDTVNRSSPVQVGSLSTWKALSNGYGSIFVTGS